MSCIYDYTVMPNGVIDLTYSPVVIDLTMYETVLVNSPVIIDLTESDDDDDMPVVEIGNIVPLIPIRQLIPNPYARNPTAHMTTGGPAPRVALPFCRVLFEESDDEESTIDDDMEYEEEDIEAAIREHEEERGLVYNPNFEPPASPMAMRIEYELVELQTERAHINYLLDMFYEVDGPNEYEQTDEEYFGSI